MSKAFYFAVGCCPFLTHGVPDPEKRDGKICRIVINSANIAAARFCWNLVGWCTVDLQRKWHG